MAHKRDDISRNRSLENTCSGGDVGESAEATVTRLLFGVSDVFV
jgi:hypothetical protein